jgi:hypothetical protein
MHFENSPFVSQRTRVAIAIGKSFAICTLFGLVGCGPKKGSAESSGADEPAGKTPATVQEAAQVLDLSAIPLIEGAQAPDMVSITGMTGTLLVSKERQSLTLTYSDTGFLPTEVSLSAMRAELERD